MNDKDLEEYGREFERAYNEALHEQNIKYMKAALREIKYLKKELKDKRDKAKGSEKDDI
jgi:hypothetical protein